MPLNTATNTNTAAAPMPIHSMNAPGANASAANSSSANAPQPTTSQRMSASERRRRLPAALLSWLASACFASSATPAIEPITPLASIGISTSFWFGELASSLNASTYFCATK